MIDSKYQLLELTIATCLAKQWLSHASVDRIAPVPKEPMARRLTLNKVIESVLDSSYDDESGIENPSFPLPSASGTRTMRHARLHEIYTNPTPPALLISALPQTDQTRLRIWPSPHPPPCELLYESADRTRTYVTAGYTRLRTLLDSSFHVQ